MRLIKHFLLGSSLALACCGPAAAESARKMLQACEILQRGMHIEGDAVYLPPGNEVNQCWSFMSAVLQYATLADKDGKTLLSACPGPEVTTIQVIGLFVAYAQSHPDKLSLNTAALTYNAMADAFPCK